MSRFRLTTKGRRDKHRAARRLATVKSLTAQPVLKNVDVKAIAAEFEKKKQQQTRSEPSAPATPPISASKKQNPPQKSTKTASEKEASPK